MRFWIKRNGVRSSKYNQSLLGLVIYQYRKTLHICISKRPCVISTPPTRCKKTDDLCELGICLQGIFQSILLVLEKRRGERGMIRIFLIIDLNWVGRDEPKWYAGREPTKTLTPWRFAYLGDGCIIIMGIDDVRVVDVVTVDVSDDGAGATSK